VIAQKKNAKKIRSPWQSLPRPEGLRALGTLNLSQRFSQAEIAVPIIQLVNGNDHGIGVSIVATGRNSFGSPTTGQFRTRRHFGLFFFPYTAYPTPPETASGIARTLDGRQHFPASARWFGGGIGTASCGADFSP